MILRPQPRRCCHCRWNIFHSTVKYRSRSNMIRVLMLERARNPEPIAFLILKSSRIAHVICRSAFEIIGCARGLPSGFQIGQIALCGYILPSYGMTIALR
jgi:hypothetical protein